MGSFDKLTATPEKKEMNDPAVERNSQETKRLLMVPIVVLDARGERAPCITHVAARRVCSS